MLFDQIFYVMRFGVGAFLAATSEQFNIYTVECTFDLLQTNILPV